MFRMVACVKHAEQPVKLDAQVDLDQSVIGSISRVVTESHTQDRDSDLHSEVSKAFA